MTILESSRLLFRGHELDDLEPYCVMESDPEVRRYVGGSPRCREDAERRFRNGLEAPITNRLAMWATVLKKESRYIGRCGLYPHFHGDDIVSGEATLAFYIAREYWGQGLATEAAQAFVQFGFEELALTRIVATVQEGNAASVRVLEKLGFRLIEKETGYRVFLKFKRLP